jgi:hypothetical protein
MIIWVPGGLFAIKVMRVGAGAPDAYMRRMLTTHVSLFLNNRSTSASQPQ